ncbi:MAG: saccharopine dehydrogenase family protein [Thermoplasmata archaeon]
MEAKLMNILVLGAGYIGEAIAHDLSKNFELTIADIDEEDLKKVERYGDTIKVDASDYEEVKEAMKGFDLVVECLPGKFGYQTLEAAIEAGKDIVSVSFMPEDPLQLDEKAKDAGVTIIPDAGFGPGLPNVCLSIMNDTFDDFQEVLIHIAGLPLDPQPPLYYRITWSPENLIDEYKREARIVKDGEITSVDPLKEIKDTEIKDLELEAFLSDGLRTLLTTLDVPDIEEWTMRWEGHLDKIKTLRELGFFKEENLENTIDVITPHMKYYSKDFCIMQVKGKGTIDGEEKEVKYDLYDEEKDDFTSMARTTGFTTAIVAKLLAEGEFGSGVIPPECLDRETCETVLSEVKERDISIEKSQRSL